MFSIKYGIGQVDVRTSMYEHLSVCQSWEAAAVQGH